MRVHPLVEKNFPAFYSLFTEIMRQEFPEYTPKTLDFFTSDKYIQEMWNDPIKFGAFVDNTLVGYIVCRNARGGVAFIHWLAVARNYQKRGIGTELLKRCEEEALKHGVHNIQLNTYERDIDYYKTRGYEVIGLDEKSWFGVDAYILKKLLQEPKEKNYLRYE